MAYKSSVPFPIHLLDDGATKEDITAFIQQRLFSALQAKVDSQAAKIERRILYGTGRRKPKGLIVTS